MPPRAAPGPVRHLTKAELAERLQVDETTLALWRRQGKGPDYIRAESAGSSATIRYPLAWVEEWENSRRLPATA